MIKYIYAALLAIVMVTRPAKAQTCVSFFAAQAFTDHQCSQALQVFNNVHTPCMAILWKTFTLKQNNLCAQRFLSKYRDKKHILQVHFSNEAGRRNRRLSGYEYAPTLSVHEYNTRAGRRHAGTLRIIQSNAKAIKNFLRKHGNSNSLFLISTGLEDNFTTKAFKNILATIKQVIEPNVHNVRFVRNPVGHHEKYYIGADFIELHGVRPDIKSKGKCIQNLDGISIKFSSGEPDSQEILLSSVPSFIQRGISLSCLNILWWKEPQGIKAIFKHPRSRKFLIEPYKINLINNLIRRFENEN